MFLELKIFYKYNFQLLSGGAAPHAPLAFCKVKKNMTKLPNFKKFKINILFFSIKQHVGIMRNNRFHWFVRPDNLIIILNPFFTCRMSTYCCVMS